MSHTYRRFKSSWAAVIQFFRGASLQVGAFVLGYLVFDGTSLTGGGASATMRLLLGVGLFLAMAGVDTPTLLRVRREVGLAVTFGLGFKVAMGLIVLGPWIGWRLGALCAIAIAQIDPIAAARGKSNGLSVGTVTLILAWASLDDPVTVLLGTLVLPNAAGASINLAILALVVSVTIVLWKAASHQRRLTGLKSKVLTIYSSLGATQQQSVALVVAIPVFAFGIATDQLVICAAAGLLASQWNNNFFKSARPRLLDAIMHAAILLLGILVAQEGADIPQGIALGTAIFAGQIIVGSILGRKRSRTDRISISLAQQSGITAVILAVAFDLEMTGVAPVVTPAIVTVNVLHWASTHFAQPNEDDTPTVWEVFQQELRRATS